jgi:hypothetical protein
MVVFAHHALPGFHQEVSGHQRHGGGVLFGPSPGGGQVEVQKKPRLGTTQ